MKEKITERLQRVEREMKRRRETYNLSVQPNEMEGWESVVREANARIKELERLNCHLSQMDLLNRGKS